MSGSSGPSNDQQSLLSNGAASATRYSPPSPADSGSSQSPQEGCSAADAEATAQARRLSEPYADLTLRYENEDRPAGAGASSASAQAAAEAAKQGRTPLLSGPSDSSSSPSPSSSSSQPDQSKRPRSAYASPAPALSFCASPRAYQLQWICFFLLGTINNLSYVVINSAAKSLADSFGDGDLIGAIVWANVAFGIGIRFLNTFALLETKVTHRVIASCILCVLGVGGVALGTMISFWFCLVAVVLVGCFSSLGESVLLGFLREFDPALMGAWSSGTGMAGILGTLSYLLMFSVIGLSNRTIFISLLPFTLVYWVAFRYVSRTHRRRQKAAKAEAAREAQADALAAGRDGHVRTSSISVVMKPTSPSASRHASSTGDAKAKAKQKKGAYTDVAVSTIIVHPDDEDDRDAAAALDAGIMRKSSLSSALGSPRARNSSPHHASSATLTLLNHEASPQPGEHGRFSSLDGSSGKGRGLDVDDEDANFDADADADTDTDANGDAYETLEQQQFYASERGLARTWRVTKIVASPGFQLASVYFFEYMVSVGFASKANPHASPDDWWATNAYELLAFCYQVGVFFARSSVSLLQIRRIEILTTLQALQFVLWFIHATHPFLPLWLQLCDMIIVGLLGGLMYVNTFYLLVKEKRLRKADQELGINLVAISINVGIVVSSVLEIVLFTTMLKDD